MEKISKLASQRRTSHEVVIIGGGFAGLYAARHLGNSAVRVTLIDRRNFHLFQPLLYQVATGGLSPGDIASPLRAVLSKFGNIRVVKGEADGFDPVEKTVRVSGRIFRYDTLIVAAGSRLHYFGNERWAPTAPGLKSVEDALEIRRRILQAFENAENLSPEQDSRAAITFVVVGGGPTGVELAGALAELAHFTLRNNFRRIDPTRTRILLLEYGPRLLPAYAPTVSRQARRSLERLGVEVRTATRLTEVLDGSVVISGEKGEETVPAATVLWGAGVKAERLADLLAEQLGITTDAQGRIAVGPDLSVPGHPEIFVLGDMALCRDRHGTALPGIAPVAMQQGRYVADLLRRRLQGKSTRPFRYFDKGKLAVIGRNAAVAEFGRVRLAGWPAWLIWVFVHIAYLIEFDNKVLVLFQWAYNYFTRKRGARLITEDHPDFHPAKPDAGSESR